MDLALQLKQIDMDGFAAEHSTTSSDDKNDSESVDSTICLYVQQGIEHTLREMEVLFHEDGLDVNGDVNDDVYVPGDVRKRMQKGRDSCRLSRLSRLGRLQQAQPPTAPTPPTLPTDINGSALGAEETTISSGKESGCRQTQSSNQNTSQDQNLPMFPDARSHPPTDNLIPPTSANTSLTDHDNDHDQDDDHTNETGKEDLDVDHHLARKSPKGHSYQCSTMTTIDDDRASLDLITSIFRIGRNESRSSRSPEREANRSSVSSSSYVGDENESMGLDDVSELYEILMEQDHLDPFDEITNRAIDELLDGKRDHEGPNADAGADTRDDCESNSRKHCPRISSAPGRDKVNYDADEDKTIGTKPDGPSEQTQSESLAKSSFEKRNPEKYNKGITETDQAVPIAAKHHQYARPSVTARGLANHSHSKVKSSYPRNRRDLATLSSETALSTLEPISKSLYSTINTTGSDESSAWFGFNESHPKVLPLPIKKRNQYPVHYASDNEDSVIADDDTDEENDRLREALLRSFDQQMVRSEVDHALSVDWDEDDGTLVSRRRDGMQVDFILADLQRLMVTTAYPFQQCAAHMVLDDFSDCEGDADAAVVHVDPAEDSGIFKPLDFDGIVSKVAGFFMPTNSNTPRDNGLLATPEQQFGQSTYQAQIAVPPEHYDTDFFEDNVCIDGHVPHAMLHSVRGFVGFNSESPGVDDDDANDDGEFCNCGSRRNRNDLVTASSIEDLGEASKPEDLTARRRKVPEIGGPCNAKYDVNRSDDEAGGAGVTISNPCPGNQDDALFSKHLSELSNYVAVEESKSVHSMGCLESAETSAGKPVFFPEAEQDIGDKTEIRGGDEIEITLSIDPEEFNNMIGLNADKDEFKNESEMSVPVGDDWTLEDIELADHVVGAEKHMLELERFDAGTDESTEESLHSIILDKEKEIRLSLWATSPRECPWENDDFSIDYPEDGDLSNDSLCIPSPPTVKAIDQSEYGSTLDVIPDCIDKTVAQDLLLPVLSSVPAKLASEAVPAFINTPTTMPLSSVTLEERISSDGNLLSAKPAFSFAPPSPSLSLTNRIPCKMPKHANATNPFTKLLNSSNDPIRQTTITTSDEKGKNSDSTSCFVLDQENCARPLPKPDRLHTSRPSEGNQTSSFLDTAKNHTHSSLTENDENCEGRAHSARIQSTRNIDFDVVVRGGSVQEHGTVQSNVINSFLSVWHDLCEEKGDLNKGIAKTKPEVKGILRKDGSTSRIHRVRWAVSEMSKGKFGAKKPPHFRNTKNKIICPLDAMIDHISKLQELGQEGHNALIPIQGRHPPMSSGQPSCHHGYMC